MEAVKKIRIKKINIVKNEDVYDIKVRNNHNFFANGILVHNCGEIVLSPYDSCRLLVLNLTSYIENPFTNDAKFNYNLFDSHVIVAQRLLDDLVDLEIEQIDKILAKIESDPEDEETKRIEKNLWKKIKETAIKGRRTGLGITGLGDAVAMLGIKYGSDKSISITESIYKHLAISAEKSSVILAEERGAFPIWNYELEKDHPFLNRIWAEDKETAEKHKKYGRRNIALTTTAPTGTTSLMTQTTSGIEPVFMLDYKRRKKILSDTINELTPDFVDQNGDKWKEFTVYHHGLKQWMDITGEIDITKSPYWGATANEIDHIKTVEIQSAAQKYLEHSISKTCNLPKDVSKELVSDLYFRAWETGCKGFTIYREGSRSGVLVTNDEKKKNEDNEFKENHAPKRPKELVADYYVAKSSGKEYAVIVGLWPGTNRPYEVFAFENPPASKNTRGKIVKVKKGQYKFINGEFEIENVQLSVDRVEQRMLTLTASMLLRHGAPIPHVINVIKKIDENITSFSAVVRRYLSRYIEEEKLNEKCPECGSDLIREENCTHCTNCPYSKCG